MVSVGVLAQRGEGGSFLLSVGPGETVTPVDDTPVPSMFTFYPLEPLFNMCNLLH